MVACSIRMHVLVMSALHCVPLIKALWLVDWILIKLICCTIGHHHSLDHYPQFVKSEGLDTV